MLMNLVLITSLGAFILALAAIGVLAGLGAVAVLNHMQVKIGWPNDRWGWVALAIGWLGLVAAFLTLVRWP